MVRWLGGSEEGAQGSEGVTIGKGVKGMVGADCWLER